MKLNTVNPVDHGSTTILLGIGQPKHNDSRPTPCLSTSQDNCSRVDVIIITQSTNEISVRVAITPQWEFELARHRGANPTYSRSTSEDNNNGVGVKADTLCSTGANVKVNTIAEALWTTDQQSHPGDNEPLDISNSILF